MHDVDLDRARARDCRVSLDERLRKFTERGREHRSQQRGEHDSPPPWSDLGEAIAHLAELRRGPVSARLDRLPRHLARCVEAKPVEHVLMAGYSIRPAQIGPSLAKYFGVPYEPFNASRIRVDAPQRRDDFFPGRRI